MSNRRALVLAPVMPEYDRESGSRRIFDLLMFLRESGWSLTFVAQRAPDGERYQRMLQQRGIATFVGFDLLTDQMMSTGRYDLALFEFWNTAEQHLPFMRCASPSTRVVVDSIDLHFVRHARQAFLGAATESSSTLLDNRYGSEMVRELNVYAAADGVLTVSQKEAGLLNDLLADQRAAHCVPDCEELAASTVPYAERKGILFLGSFRHTPNVDAIEYLCREVLPKVDPAVLAAHPLHVVGTGLNDTIREFAKGLANVHMVGWVPSVLPYLERTRLTVIPLLYGAGTKRKLVQALMVGTPTVSTSIGVEGLGLRHGEHVLIADDAASFARSITRLCRDAGLWSRLAKRGRAQILPVHGREAARVRFLDSIEAVLAAKPKSSRLTKPDQDHQYRISLHYQRLGYRVREAVAANTPAGATVIVVSKGDEQLTSFDQRVGWHFPQDDAGVYAGHYPADSAGAIAHLEALRAKGGDFLVFPNSAFWWLDHYAEFKEHLLSRHRPVSSNQHCRIFDLRKPTVTAAEASAANNHDPTI